MRRVGYVAAALGAVGVVAFLSRPNPPLPTHATPAPPCETPAAPLYPDEYEELLSLFRDAHDVSQVPSAEEVRLLRQESIRRLLSILQERGLINPASVGNPSVVYDPRLDLERSDKYAQTRWLDPAQTRVIIQLTPAAWETVPVFVSTVIHEWRHVEQLWQWSGGPVGAELAGQLTEDQREAAQELDAYMYEIEMAGFTQLPAGRFNEVLRRQLADNWEALPEWLREQMRSRYEDAWSRFRAMRATDPRNPCSARTAQDVLRSHGCGTWVDEFPELDRMPASEVTGAQCDGNQVVIAYPAGCELAFGWDRSACEFYRYVWAEDWFGWCFPNGERSSSANIPIRTSSSP
jgi:hypothetical protein